MSVRTPGIQSRSQYHSYWGTYPYMVGAGVWANGSNSLPGAPGNVISATEFAKLETGDIASTSDSSSINRGLYTCTDTSGGNGLVEWRRLDNASLSTQTIRDAHVIVVAQEGAGWNPTTGVPATDALLNLNPQVATIAADFIDTGDGAGLSAALVAALALSAATPSDVRLRPCSINLNTGAVLGPLSIPASTRLVGSQDNECTIIGRNGLGEDQRILTLAGGAAVEKIQLNSLGPTAAPIGAGGILETLGAGCDVTDCIFNLQVGVAARTTLACIDSTTAATGGQRLVVDRCRFVVGTANSHRLAFGTDSVAIRTQGSNANTTEPGVTLHALTIQLFDVGVRVVATLTSGDVALSQITMARMFRAGVSMLADATVGSGYRFSDVRVGFDATGATAVQTAIEIDTATALGAIDQVSLSGWTVFFPAGSAVATLNFARLTGAVASAGITGVKMIACGIEFTANTATATDAIVLANLVSRSGDLLCDWNNVPIVPTNVIAITAGTPTWEHAHMV